MKNKNKKYLFVTLLTTVTVSVAVALLIKKIKERQKLTVISDAGYETAHDVNFPLKINSPQKAAR